MSAVDPKPTYSLRTEASLLSLALSQRRQVIREWLLGVTGLELKAIDRLNILDSIHRGSLALDVDDDIADGDSPHLVAELIASRADAIKSGIDNDGIQAVGEAFRMWCPPAAVFRLGSAAAFELCDDIILNESVSDSPVSLDWAHAARLACAITKTSAYVLKMHPGAIGANCDNMHIEAVQSCKGEWSQREVAEDISYHTVSRRVRAAYAFAISKRSFPAKARLYPDGPNKEIVLQRLSGAIRRDSDVCPSIEYFFLGQVRAIKRGNKVYIMDQDNIRKIYQIFHRRFMAVFSTVCQSVTSFGAYTSDVVRVLTASLIKSAAALSRNGKPISHAARSMHQLWCAEFTAAYDPDARSYWQPHYDEIVESAYAMNPTAVIWHRHIKEQQAYNSLELLRLHHIMAAPDTPADLLAQLTFDIPNKARAPDPAAWSSFMRFVKTYELCMYLYKKREWPRVESEEGAMVAPAYNRCLNGKFAMPPDEEHGRVYISQHFPYVKYADSLPLRAKDATRIPYDRRNAVVIDTYYEPYEHNELTHALIKGMNLGSPLNLTVAQARDQFWNTTDETPVLADCAAKAEATKSDCKPRGTFSANGEFRHMQAEFDRNCQVVNDIIGCGSIRADVAHHARGIANVTRGTRLGRMTTSHDIEGWSPSQDRSKFIEFGSYRAGMFRGMNPDGWASKWKCFDIVVNKPGVHEIQSQFNGGYQGFPGTLDTSLHVLILTQFLWKMRAKGRIPSDVVTLAKATIDDCLAQMGTWMGTELDLEIELKDHYSRLGYKIDAVKSIISKSKAIYLNQASINGGQVSQGLKVILKADRPLEVVMSTPFEDFMSCTSGAKAAIAVGHEPISAYFATACLGVLYMIKAAPQVADLSADQFSVAAALPRGDGGFGLPHLPDLVCKEHPDQRSHANHILYVFARCRKMIETPIEDKALHTWASLKSVPWALVHKHSIFFNPRNATRSGIPSIENIRRGLIIGSARDWAKAEPYKTVLASSRNSSLMDLYGMFVTHDVAGIDAAFLEAYSSHLPESIIDSLVGKVTSYRVAKEICGASEVISAQIAIQSMFRNLVNDIITAPLRSTYDPRDLALDMEMVSGYKRAQQEREEFYAYNNVNILAHTIPSPFECIAVVDAMSTTEGTTHIASDMGSLQVWAKGAKRCTRTAISSHGVSWPFKSQNWVAESADTFRLLDVVTNKFVEGCSILSWAEQAGMKTAQWEEVFFARWCGDMSLRASQFTTKSLQGSIKRSAAAFGDKYHPVFVYPNLQRSVMVTVSPILNLLSKGNYDIDPMSIIATSYAIGAVNMGYIMDQFAILDQDCPQFTWRIGLHTDLYEEARHLEIEVKLPSNFIRDIWELELEGLDFLSNDGGMCTQLRELLEPGGVVALLSSSLAVDDDSALPNISDLPPMISLPVAAPLGAAFLVMSAAKRVAGTIVSDTVNAAKVERLLEISPQSFKLCAVAAIQEHKITTHAVNSRLLGDIDAVTDEELAEEAAQIAKRTVELIRSNVPTEHPYYQAAKALRACGLVGVQWGDVTNMSMGHFMKEVRRTIRGNPMEALNCLHAYGRDILLSTSGKYESRPLRVQASRDPDKSNKAARLDNLRHKFRVRAKEYEARIKAAKVGTSTIKRDMGVKNVDRKIVYLVAARTFMSCVDFFDDLSVDIEETMHKVLSRINAKLVSLKAEPTVTDHTELIVDGRVSREAVERANYKPSSKGWYPDEYARGILAAERWAHEDAEHEKKIVYFTPRAVEVKVRVRTHHATVIQHVHERTPAKGKEKVVEPEPEPVEEPLDEDDPWAGIEDAEEITDAEELAALEDKPSAIKGLDAMGSMFGKARRPKEEYEEFVRQIDIWQMVLIHQHNGADYPIKGKKSDKLRLAMQPTKLKRGDLGAKALAALEESTASVMWTNQSALIAPVPLDAEVSEHIME